MPLGLQDLLRELKWRAGLTFGDFCGHELEPSRLTRSAKSLPSVYEARMISWLGHGLPLGFPTGKAIHIHTVFIALLNYLLEYGMLLYQPLFARFWRQRRLPGFRALYSVSRAQSLFLALWNVTLGVLVTLYLCHVRKNEQQQQKQLPR